TLRGSLRPERTCYDVLYYHLNIRVDPGREYISGYNEFSFRAVDDFSRMQVDLFENMRVDSIVWEGRQLKYRREYNAVFIEFPETVRRDAQGAFRFYYSGHPVTAARAPWDGGFVWSADKEGRPW